MKKGIVLFFLLLFLCSCSNEEKQSVQKINCVKMEELLNDGAVLLDVRSLEEYNISHLEEAISMPYENIANTISEKVNNTETLLIVYCQSGRRSAIAAQTLLDKGYKHVFDLGSIDTCQ